VTDLIKAQRSIISISASGGASITFEADASVEEIDLADGNLGLKAGHQAKIGY
jgi:hypothetical protein